MAPSACDIRLPHGPEFRFVTTVTELERGGRATGCWQVLGDEPFFRGHFPGNPVVPGVLLAESLAQLCGIAAIQGGDARLAHVDVRFDAPIAPPADIVLRAALARRFGALLQFDVEAEVRGVRAARGSITLVETPNGGAKDGGP